MPTDRIARTACASGERASSMTPMSLRLPMLLVRALAVSAAAAAPAQAATLYTATPIPTLGGVSNFATGINASGAIAGWSYTDGLTAAHAFTFAADGTLTDLKTLGGAQSFAQAINDDGVVTGYANPPNGNALHAFRFAAGTMTDVHPAAGVASAGNAISGAGEIAGTYTDASGRSRAFTYAADVFFDLGTLGGDTASVTARNSNFQIVGHSTRADGARHAFRANIVDMIDLGTLGGNDSVALGIDAAGDVVGYSTLAGGAGPHAFFYAGGDMQDLGTLDGGTSSAAAINAAAHIVGTASVGGGSRAFVYADGAMRDLNPLVGSGLNGAVLTSGVAINNAGQIAAQACIGLVCRSYRLDPVTVPAVQAIEYYYPAFDHYFMTAIPDEIAKLDNGAFPGWVRTGQSFAVQAGPQAGTSPVCRFFGTSFAPKSSHFYTPFPDECVIVRRDPAWGFEGIVFYVAVPAFDGRCPAGTSPVYRLYNDGMGGAPNHRYTTSVDVREQMIALGWIPEGRGAEGVTMCAAA